LHLGLQPFLVVRSETTKADSRGKRRRRTVPLWWDAGTLADLTTWVALQRAAGADDEDYVVSTRTAGRIDCAAARRAFQSACRILGRHVTIHDGRHSFASHAIAGGRSLVEVRDALGHRSLATTSIYAHLVEEDEGVGNLFGEQSSGDGRKVAVPLVFQYVA
jgi:integrase